MPKYSGFDPIESHNVVTTSSTTSSINHSSINAETLIYLPYDSSVDDQAQGVTGTLRGGSPGAHIQSTVSKFGGASLALDGSNDRVEYNGDNIVLGTDDFTMECWFYMTNNAGSSHSTVHTLFGKMGGASSRGFNVQVAGGNALAMQYSTTGSQANQRSFTFGLTVSLNTWHHMAVVRDGPTITGYLDGVAGGTTHNAGSDTIYDNGAIFEVGYKSISSGGAFHGYIDDISIVKGHAKYKSNFTPPTSALGVFEGSPVTLYLPFDSDIQDDSIFGHTVTAFGNAAISSTQAKFGGNSLFIDADGDYLTIPSNPGFKFEQEDFTIEMFIRPDDVSTTDQTNNVATILDHDQDASTAGAWFALHQNNQALVFSSNNGSNSFTSSNCLSAATWHHIAVVRLGDVMTIYCDGVAVGSASHSYNFSDTTTRELYIGKQVIGGGGTRRFDGYIDDLRITKGVGRYKRNFIPPVQAVGATLNGANETNTTTGFTSLYLPFDSDLNDESSFNHTATASGSAAISSTQAKFGGNSLSLNGTSQYLTIANDASFQFGSGDFTIEMWIYMTSNAGSSPGDRHTLVGRRTSSTDRSYHVGIQLDSGQQKLQFSHSTSGSGGTQTNYDTDIQLNTWTHVAIVRSGSRVYAFVDGVMNESTHSIGTDTINPGNSNLTIGHRVESSQYFPGYIDDLRILKGYAKYTGDFVPPSSAVGTSVSETVNDLTVLYMPFDATATSSSAAADLYLPFDSDLNDDSSNASTGTASGGAAISSTQSKFGGYSLYLDGTNDYVTYDNLALGTDDFTIEAFIYDTKSSGYREIVNTYYTGANGEWLFRINSSGGNNDRLGFSYRAGGGWATSINSPTNAISQDTWHHVAAVRSGDTLTLYIDGSAVVSGSVSSLDGVNKAIQLGSYNSGAGQFFGGYIDDLRIIKGTALYTSNFTVPTSALGATGTVSSLQGGFEDLARKFPARKSGDATLSTSVKKFGTSSAYFDGTGDSILMEDTTKLFKFTGDFTIECQVYPTTTGQDAVLGFHGSSGTSGWILQTGYNSGGGSSVGGRFYTNSGALVLNTSAININTWSHVAITRSGSTVRLFVNGSLEDSGTFSTQLGGTGSTQDLRIGGSTNASTQPFQGYIDDLRIIEGHAVYTSAFTAPTSAVGTEISETSTSTTTDTKVLSSTWTMTNDGSSPRSFIDMRSDNTWANNEHLQSQSSHRWNPANAGGTPGTTATGGSIATPGNGYRYHVFTSPGTFELSAIDGGSPSLAVEYLVVAGGGGGGGDRAGGGGAGGLRTNEDGNPKAGSSMTIATGSFPVVVGTGGSGGVWPSPTTSDKGGTSSFNSISATGGGTAGINTGGGEGGSGGGGTTHGYGGGGPGNQGGYTPPEGNDGGAGGYPRGGGGGGGAGAVGSNASNPDGGNGGAGHAMPSFAGPILSPVIPGGMATAIGPTGLYAGGGGGGGQGSGNGGTGGPGGGGNGGKASVSPGSYNPTSNEYGPAGAPGVDGTGGGGGGAGNFPGTNPNMRPGGDGGNGVVIIKYSY